MQKKLPSPWIHLSLSNPYSPTFIIVLCFPCVCTQAFSRVWLFAILQTVARRNPLSLAFSRREHWSGLPFLSPIGAINMLWKILREKFKKFKQVSQYHITSSRLCPGFRHQRATTWQKTGERLVAHETRWFHSCREETCGLVSPEKKILLH